MASKNDKMVVGVTGIIGSGKTTVCELFKKKGIPVFYADVIAKELSVSEPMLREKIAVLVGNQAFKEDGSLNRQYIADKIFKNIELRKKYEQLLHPFVHQEILKQIQLLNTQAIPFVVIEAALLFEAGWDTICDVVIVVEADEDVSMKRVAERDGVQIDEIKLRYEAQWKQRTKVSKADFVIHNNSTIRELEQTVEFFYRLLIQWKGERNRG